MTAVWNYADFPFDLLHMEIVSHFKNKANDGGADQQPASSSENGVKLENMGFRVGYGMVERVSKEFPRIGTELDAMKFICKDFWSAVFRKQVDNLRTNHQGMYVVHDNNFCFVASLSTGDQYKAEASRFLEFSTGLIRGAMMNLGHQCTVSAEVTVLPNVKFTVAIQS